MVVVAAVMSVPALWAVVASWLKSWDMLEQTDAALDLVDVSVQGAAHRVA